MENSVALNFCILLLIITATSCSNPSNIEAENSQTKQPKTVKESKPENISQELPKTVKEAVDIILSNMSESDKNLIRNTKKEDLINFHHGLGTSIRNQFGLWGKNKELMADTKTSHPDDASMVIIQAVWERLQQENK